MERISVEALQYHTYDGETYHAGDVYDVDPQYLETLEALQFVRRHSPKDRGKPKPVDHEAPGLPPRRLPTPPKPTKD